MNSALRRRFADARESLRQGHHQQAIGALQEVVAALPGHRDARLALALAHFQAGQLAEALATFRELHQRFPQDAEAASYLGAILSEVGRQDEAIHAIATALQHDPLNTGAMTNLGEILKRMGDWHGARETYAAAIAVDPADAKLHIQHGMICLGLGDWHTGWTAYEHRLQSRDKPLALESVHSPRLQPGDALSPGQRVVVLHEQGLGDSVMFARLATRLAAGGVQVHLRCPAPLVPLLQRLPGLASCTAVGSSMPVHDWHVPLMSLPHVLRLTPAMISGAPYLEPPGECPAHVAALLPPDDRLTVAVCWSGNPDHVDNRRRSIRTELLTPLMSMQDVRLAAMQKAPAAEVLLPAAWYPEWIDLGAACQDFSESAHALQRVDLVVTVDTAVAHLAGALGRPTLLLLPLAPDFRWELGHTTTRWYDRMTLMRQSQEFDWPTVIGQVREEILRRAAGHRPA